MSLKTRIRKLGKSRGKIRKRAGELYTAPSARVGVEQLLGVCAEGGNAKSVERTVVAPG